MKKVEAIIRPFKLEDVVKSITDAARTGDRDSTAL